MNIVMSIIIIIIIIIMIHVVWYNRHNVVGLGLGMAYLPAIVAVSFYFEKRRSLATGIAVCGSGIGTFAFAPLTDALIQEYSWKGTVLIEAAILLNCILCGMVFRPLNVPKKVDPPETEPVMEEKPQVGAEQTKIGIKSASNLELPQTASTSKQDAARRRQFSESHKASHSPAVSRTSSTHLTGPMARKDVFYTKSLDHIPQYRADRDEYLRSMTSLPEQPEPQPDKSCLARIGITAEMRQTVSEMMDFRLFLDAVFILFAVSNLLTSIGFVVPYIFLPNRGLRYGFSSSQSSWLISMVGISNTVGRVVFGYIADMKFVNRLMLYNTVLVICGICSVFSVLMWTYPLQMCYSFCFGFFIGKS